MPTIPFPPVSDVWRAIDAYMRLSYPSSSAQPSAAVRDRLKTLRSLSGDDFFSCAAFEADSSTDPARWALRLGNAFYPHMKLCIDRRPDANGYVFRVNTHDKHCCPPRGSREYGAFCALMQKNQDLSQAIESDWQSTGLPTFKAYLRADLAKRKAGEGDNRSTSSAA